MYLTILLVIILLLECVYYIYFINKNKQEKVEYFRDIPSNESPAIVGLMVKGNVDGNDIIATILDLWEKEYINVEYKTVDGKQKCIIKDAGKDRFIILKDYENYLLDQMFKEGNEIVFENFVDSPNFESIFNNIGKMISKRVDIKKIHKVSYKRLGAKVNFLINVFVLGFALFFPFIYLLAKKILLSVIISYLINFIMLLFTNKNITKEKNDIEHLLFGISFCCSIIYFEIITILYLLSNYTYQSNLYLNIANIFTTILQFILLFIGEYNKKNSITTSDFLFLIYSIISIIFNNLVGISICIIYFSHRIYLKSNKHSYLSKENEIDKWIALKKFLNEFSLIKERNVNEVQLWKNI